MTHAELAKKIGANLAAKAFEGRRGHGNAEGVVHRQMSEAELAAWLEGAAKLALDLGRKATP